MTFSVAFKPFLNRLKETEKVYSAAHLTIPVYDGLVISAAPAALKGRLFYWRPIITNHSYRATTHNPNPKFKNGLIISESQSSER